MNHGAPLAKTTLLSMVTTAFLIPLIVRPWSDTVAMLGAWRKGSPQEMLFAPRETVSEPIVDEVPVTETLIEPGIVTAAVHDWPVWQIVVVVLGLVTVSVSAPQVLLDVVLLASPEYEACQ